MLQALGGFFAPRLHLDSVQPVAVLVHKIHLVIALAPVIHLAGLLYQFTTHRQFERAATLLGIAAHRHSRRHAVERRTSRQHLGAGTTRQMRFGQVFSQRMQQKSTAIQCDVVLDQIGIALVLQLPQQLGVADFLCWIGAQNLERLPKQRRVGHPPALQNVLADHGLDNRVLHVGIPAVGVMFQHHRARVAAVGQIAIQIIAKCRLQFGKTPMVYAQ